MGILRDSPKTKKGLLCQNPWGSHPNFSNGLEQNMTRLAMAKLGNPPYDWEVSSWDEPEGNSNGPQF